MQKPNNYDKEAAVNLGEGEVLEPGGYICTIKKAEVGKSQSGNEMLILLFDINEGDKKGFYERRYKADSRSDKKWGGIFRQVTGGNSTKFFKGIINSIEESNSGFKFDFDESKLVGKVFGGIFGREEYFNMSSGEYKFATKLLWIRNVDAVRKGNYKIPEDKLADRNNNNNSNFVNSSETVVNDEDLPF